MYSIESYRVVGEEPMDLDYHNSLPKVCSYCQESYTLTNPQTLDHIKPLSSLGKSRCKSIGFRMISNLVICCRDCNVMKGSLTLKEFRHILTYPNARIPSNRPGAHSNIHLRMSLSPEKRMVMVNSINILLDDN